MLRSPFEGLFEMAAIFNVAEVFQLLALGAVHFDLAARDRLAGSELALQFAETPSDLVLPSPAHGEQGADCCQGCEWDSGFGD